MSNEATRAQIDAALPNRSTWLSANAGSGKTRVLTDRVALLLLQGVQPQRILCLTYTKAAASEMQNRLFKRLGAWAMMPDAELTSSLLALGVARGEVNSETLRKARVLFAKAIETPGGLKIQTIHSFCAALLRRFPLEAKVSPAFIEMDDRTSKRLRSDVLDQLADDQPDLVRAMTDHFTGEDPDSVLAEIARNTDSFDTPASDAALKTLFELPQGLETDEDTVQIAFNGTERALIARAGPILANYSPTMVKLAEKLAEFNFENPNLQDLEVAFDCFLYRQKEHFLPSAKTGSVPTKKVQDDPAFPLEEFQSFMERVAEARAMQLALRAFHRSKALHAFAAPFLRLIAETKKRRGWLDFDDLIRKARELLTDHEVAAWVLFRLDGGIDHILIDEAQDTSPAQWDVIRLLSEEFFAGDGAQTEQRTVFVVGDKKQSIYSFQGADPAEFDRMRAYFEQRHADIKAPFAARELLYSFRSAAPILQLVDEVFTEDLRRGMGETLEHKPFKDQLPGRVDIWDWVEGTDKEPEKQWFDPVDTVGQNHHSVVLAGKIADHIEDQIAHGQITQILREDGEDKTVTRRIRAGDFLILVTSRSGQGRLFDEIIRACKKRNLPMAGADRLRVGAELGVRDLVSLLSFLETPQNDLALAEIMRSPLGNLSEEDLFSIAYGRKGLLWDSLDARQGDFPDIHAMLKDLRGQADFMRPYDLLERVLTRHHGRERLLARLGQEAEEGITALLDQSLQYELMEAPTLTGFLTWLATDDVTIKRQMDADSDLIRVMTVHGAKGLEAPIVILPQTGPPPTDIRDDILKADETPLWKTRTADATTLQTGIIDEMKQLDSQENMRLLYVAMTRAESWLITCGSGELPKKGNSWYEIIETGMGRAGAVAQEGVKLRTSHGIWPAATDALVPQEPASVPPLDPWMTAVATPPAVPPKTLQPSNLGGAKVLVGASASLLDSLSEEDAKQRGTMIHLLLEHLSKIPKNQRKTQSDRLLRSYENPLGEDLFSYAEAVLDAPDLAFLYDNDALVEVPLSASLPELDGRRVEGAIDRLIIDNDRVLAVDFKSNRDVPQTPQDTPEGVLRQMGAYAAALAQIYPDRRIETAIVWTETAQIMSLPHDIVSMALSRAHTS